MATGNLVMAPLPTSVVATTTMPVKIDQQRQSI